MTIRLTGTDEVTTKPLLSMAVASAPDLADTSVPAAGAKLHLALGEDSPGLDTVTTAIQTGQTEGYKKLLADKDVLERRKARNDVLQSILQTDPSMITPEVINVVQGLSDLEIASPDLSDIIEKKYSKLYTETATAALQNDILEDAVTSDPEKTLDLMDRAERMTYKNQVANTALSQLAKENDDRSYLSKAWDFGERMVPFLEWYQKHDAVGETSAMVTSILPGSNLTEQYAYLAGLSPDDFKVEFQKALDELKSRNLYVAQSWVEGFLSYGSTDAVVDNVLGAADVASVIPVERLAGALKGVVRGGLKSPLKIGEIATEVGRYSDAAKAKVVDDLKNDNFFGQNIRRIDELEQSIPSITSPNRIMEGAASLPQEAINRLKAGLIGRSEAVRSLLMEPNLLDRVTPEELTTLLDDAAEDFERQHPQLGWNVISVEPNAPDLGNVYSAKVIIGHKDGTLFESQKAAEKYVARFIKPVTNDFKIVQKGSGFQVEITKTLDESRLLSDLKIPLDQKTPDSLASATMVGGFLRSPDYLLSKQNVAARGVVVHSAENLAQKMDEITRPIGELSKGEYNELNDIMVANNLKHEFHENIGEFQKAFFNRFKKMPTEKQIDAYNAYVLSNDLDLVIRDLDWYKQKARLGLEQISFKVDKKLKEFEGKLISSLPDGDFRFAVIDDGKLVGKVKLSRFLTDADRKKVTDRMAEGWKLVQVGDLNLELAKGQHAGIILIKDVKRDRVGVKNVDRKAGGHKVHEYPFYIKQPKLSEALKGEQRFYNGDLTVFNARTQAEANEIANLLEQARMKLKQGSPDAAKFIRDNLPIKVGSFLKKVRDGEINLDAPFIGVRRGFRTIDVKNLENVVDNEVNPLNLTSRITGRYGGSRDVTNIDIIKSEANSVFRIESAPYLSPIDTLRESSANALSTRVLNDYSLMTNQNFIREFGDILDGTRKEIEASGNAYLVSPKFLPGADPRRVQAAKNVSRAYNGLMNYGSTLDRQITMTKDTLLKGVSDRLGPKGAEWIDERMLSHIKNAPTFLRSAAFHMKLGLFNVQQLFVQANSMVQVASIAGRDGLRGGLVYPFMRAALLTTSNEVLKGVAKAVGRTGLMKPEEFEESLRLFKQSGFNSVGHDVAYLDDLKGPDIRRTYVGGKIKSFLSWGTTPFIEGERVVRIAAWNAAYLEKKKIAGLRALTRRDVSDILQRAKDLTGNMTRDSNAAWQKGYVAVFTQFFGFQARIMEQMLGKKLTGPERLRLFAGFGAMYGLPVAMGSVVGVLPVRDMIIQQLSDMGIEYDDGVMEPFVDGFASSMIEFMTGEDTNLPARYGPGGLPTFYDLLRGDKTVAETFLGASGSIAIQTVRDAVPAVRGMLSEWLDYKGGVYNLTPEDMILPFRNITTVNSAAQVWNVYNLGVWASKNGTDLTKMDLPEAVLAVLTGLQPSTIEESFVKYRSVQGHREYIEEQQKEISRLIRRYMKMEDGPEREKLVRQAKAMMEIAGMTEKEKHKTWWMGANHEMLNDVFFEQYEKLQERKGD